MELLAMGAKDKPVPLTTVELAKKLHKSQQMASKHLKEMERDGMIERLNSHGKSYVKLTPKGASEASKLYSELDAVFGKREVNRPLTVEGAIFDGLGEAAYYVSQPNYKKQFIAKLGFEPFPGTLNVRLSSPADRQVRRDLSLQKGIHIEGFRDCTRSYGGAECFRATINDFSPCAVLVIERTTYDDSVLEIIAPVNLRKALHLKAGSKATVNIAVKGTSDFA